MARMLTMTMTLLCALATLPAQAQVTRLVPLPQAAQSESTWSESAHSERQVTTQRPAAATTSANVPHLAARASSNVLRSTEVTHDPYRAMQAAYQPATPADIPPTLLPTDPTVPPSSSTIIQPSNPPVGYAQPGCAQPAAAAAPVYQQPAVVQYSYPAAPVGAVVQAPATVVTQSVPVAQVGLRPLIPVTPPQSYYVTNGLLGQPVIYVPGQPVRNFFRYLSP